MIFIMYRTIMTYIMSLNNIHLIEIISILLKHHNWHDHSH